MLFLFLSFGMETIIVLGWDVGGYTGGKNAFALATVRGSETKLRICTGEVELSNKDGLYKFPDNLFLPEDNFVVAIDAPFGFPCALLDFINNEADTSGYFERDIENVYVFRQTDREVESITGKKPLSPIFDKLGRNTFRAIRQLRKWKQDRPDLIVIPWDNEPGGNLTAIEVYPGILAGTTSFYKQFKNRYGAALNDATGFNATATSTLFSSFEKIYGSRIPKKDIHYNDEVDAAVCALMGVEFAKNKSNLSHIPSSSKGGGLIYIPSFKTQ